MNTKFKFTRKLVAACVLIVGFLLALLSSIMGGHVYAAAFVNPLTNPYFNQSYASQQISSVSGWSIITYDNYNDFRDRDGYRSGSVKSSSVTDSAKSSVSDLWRTFNLISDPGKANPASTHEKYNDYLMLNSPKAPGRIGYQTSSDFTLEANSFYKISITLHTVNKTATVTEGTGSNATDITVEHNSFASLYLTGISDQDIPAKFERVTTQNTWSTRTFYISTNPFVNEKLRLELWLGGKEVVDSSLGAVFFNDVDIQRFTETSFLNETSNIRPTDNLATIIDLNTNPYITHQLTNPSFEDSARLNGWKQLAGNYAESDFFMDAVYLSSSKLPHDIPNPGSNNSAHSNTSALLIYLKETGFLGVRSMPITIRANGYYRLSVWSISNCNEGAGGTISLAELDDDGSPLAHTSLTTETNINNVYNYRNGWEQYNFYIQGNGLKDVQVALELSLGTTDAGTSGYVLFDDVTLQQLSLSNYQEATAGSKIEVVNLEKSKEKIYMINNESFNHVTQEGINTIAYPAAAKNWTPNVTSKYASSGYMHGVINTHPTHFNQHRHLYHQQMPNPGTVGYNQHNNVLVMGTRHSDDTITYTSSSFTLDKNSVYYLSFDVFSAISLPSSNGLLSLRIFSDNMVACEIDLTNTTAAWQSKQMHIHTGLTSGTFQLQLTFANQKGYVFFDNFYLTNTPHKPQTNNVIKVNLNENDFSNYNNWQMYSSNDNSRTNTMDADNGFLKGYGIDHLENTLYIFNINSASTVAEGTNHYQLSANQHYKISVRVKTQNLAYTAEQAGASFAINFGEEYEEHINIEADDFYEYAFFIRPTNDVDVTVILGLGNPEAEVEGIAFFRDLKVSILANEEVFESEQQNYNSQNIKVIAHTIEASEEEDEQDDHDHSHDHQHNTSANIWMAVSGMITAVAIIIAMLGTALRRINWRRKPRISTTYDRRKTLDKSLSRRELIDLHNNLIKEVQAELAQEQENYNSLSALIQQDIDKVQAEMDEHTKPLKDALLQLDAKKDEYEKQLNAKLAEDKLGTTLKDDKLVAKQTAKIITQQKKLQKTLGTVENKYLNEMFKLETELKTLELKPLALQEEIEYLKQEIEKIQQKEKDAALGK